MEDKKWYMQVTYREAQDIIASNILQIRRNLIAVGYYLGYIQDNEMYLEEGYKGIGEFAYDKFGISAGSASRWIRICRKFSKGGNSPILDDKYKDFSKSQLQEMLYLEDEKLDEVTPDMTVKDIRGIRQEEEVIEDIPEEQQEKQTTKRCVTGFSKYPEHCPCCGHGGVECCAECNESCNGRCGWPEEHRASTEVNEIEREEPETVVEMQDSVIEEPEVVTETQETVTGKTEPVIDDVEETLYEEQDERTELEIAKEQLRHSQKLLKDLREYYEENDRLVRTQKVMVEALALFVTELEEMMEPVFQQPELPVLKNNEQRKKWLHDYKSWGLWYEDKNTEVVYYKYDFENGARLIVEAYIQPRNGCVPELESFYFHLIGGPEPPVGDYGITKWSKHEKYARHPNSETEMIEFLKYIQKGVK